MTDDEKAAMMGSLARIMHHHRSGAPYKEIGSVTLSSADVAFLRDCVDYIHDATERKFSDGRNVGRSEGIANMTCIGLH
jgi:hypothetical protein